MQIVNELEDMVSVDVEIDHRIHSRLIGARGRAIRQIMTDFKVDIKFPLRDATNLDVVTVSGAEDNVYECQDHLLNLAEEYIQDVRDQELVEEFTHAPSRQQQQDNRPPGNQKGFVVVGAPWDMSSQADFPELGMSGSTGASKNIPWGPSFRR